MSIMQDTVWTNFWLSAAGYFVIQSFSKFWTDPSAPWQTSYMIFLSNLRNVTHQFILKSGLSAVHSCTNNLLCIFHNFSTETDKPSPACRRFDLCWQQGKQVSGQRTLGLLFSLLNTTTQQPPVGHGLHFIEVS